MALLAPFEPPTTTISAVAHVSGSTFEATFNGPVSLDLPGTDPYGFTYATGDGIADLEWIAQTAANKITFKNNNDANPIAIVGWVHRPINVSASPPLPDTLIFRIT